MTGGLSSKLPKVFSMGNADGLIITANAPLEGASGGWRQMAFKASTIDFLFEIDKDISAMTLKNGVTIPVVMGFERLKKTVYEPDMSTGNGIDLTLVTGKVVGDVQTLRLAKKFNPVAADAEKSAREESNLELVLFAHGKPVDREFRRIRVKQKDINYFEAHADRRETETFVQLRSGAEAGGMSAFYVAMPLDHFTHYMNQALRDGDAVLDLSDRTRPANPKGMTL
ncbi:MAG: hypothetical protein PSY14_09975 [bacterium]|nr:hypothetical protein [bacterium]